MAKFKVGDHLVVSSGPLFSKGTLVTVVATDDDDHMPYLCYDGKTKLWVNEDDLGPASEADKKPEFHVGQRVRIRLLDSMKAEFGMDDFGNPNVKFGWVDNMNSLCGRTATISSIDGKYVKLKDWNDSSGDTGWCFSTDMLKPAGFEVGQIYRVGKLSAQHRYENAIIRLSGTHPIGFTVKSIRGEAPFDFASNSEYARSLTLLTGPQIGEAIKKYDAEHSEKTTASGVREVNRHAKVGEYIKIVDPMHVRGVCREYKIGDILHVEREVIGGGVACEGTTEGICDSEYVVLEGYKPEQKEEPHKAKVGDTIKVLRDNGGPVKSGTVWTVNKIDDLGLTIHNADYPATNWRLDLDNYVVLSSGKHSYTDAEIAEAKKLCGEMMVEAFDDNKTFAFHFYDKQNGGWSGDCEKNEVKADSKSFDGTEAVGIAKCSDHDEYNVWIGRCVALCKALHKPIPAFITGD